MKGRFNEPALSFSLSRPPYSCAGFSAFFLRRTPACHLRPVLGFIRPKYAAQAIAFPPSRKSTIRGHDPISIRYPNTGDTILNSKASSGHVPNGTNLSMKHEQLWDMTPLGRFAWGHDPKSQSGLRSCPRKAPLSPKGIVSLIIALS